MIIENKSDIRNSLNNFYSYISNVANVGANDFVKVSKIAIQSYLSLIDADDYLNSLDFSIVPNFDSEYVAQHVFLQVIAKNIKQLFDISPSDVLFGEKYRSLTLEWTPSFPIYVTSKGDYRKLYLSFVRYLESVSEISGSDFITDPPYIICFSAMYEGYKTDDMDIFKDMKAVSSFDKNLFHSNVLKMHTPDMIVDTSIPIEISI